MSDNPSGQRDSGILVVDKPKGVTSHDVVAAARHALHMKRVGHAGTLDPMATGVLVIGFGHATRLLNYIVGADKTYEATIRLGQATDTDDAEGTFIPLAEQIPLSGGAPAAEPSTVVGEKAHISGDIQAAAIDTITRGRIEQTIAERFTGEIMQVPNAFSAIKIDGKRAYDLAREGKKVELKARPVTISEFTVLDVRSIEFAQSGVPVIDVGVRVTCSSGTYIRALARDLGIALGVGGHLTYLRRTRVGMFSVNGDGGDDTATGKTVAPVIGAHVESRTFTNRNGETITRNRAVLDLPDGVEARSCALTMIQSAERTMPCTTITDEQARELRFGRFIDWPADLPLTVEATAAHTGNELIAIVTPFKATKAKPVVVFPAG